MNEIEDKIKDLVSPYVDIELIEGKRTFEIIDLSKEKYKGEL